MNPKPLGGKSYGSIAHLPNSRMGAGDHHCHEGQAAIATANTRDKHDFVIVQEKLDGSNVGVAKINGEILALSRSGYLARTSPYEQHSKFADWVDANRKRFDWLLCDGERVCGEWLYQAHGTRYALPHEPFVAFDLFRDGKRVLFAELGFRLSQVAIRWPFTLHKGHESFSIEDALATIGPGGAHGALDEVEGAVWRVERKGAVDFLCKYVRPDKIDGKYLPEISGQPAVLNTWPDIPG